MLLSMCSFSTTRDHFPFLLLSSSPPFKNTQIGFISFDDAKRVLIFFEKKKIQVSFEFLINVKTFDNRQDCNIAVFDSRFHLLVYLCAQAERRTITVARAASAICPRRPPIISASRSHLLGSCLIDCGSRYRYIAAVVPPPSPRFKSV